jgi:hypothetical protein
MKKSTSTKASKTWKHSFTTVTPFSKTLALALFITLPLLTFVIGVKVARRTMQWTCQYQNFREQKLLGTDHQSLGY